MAMTATTTGTITTTTTNPNMPYNTRRKSLSLPSLGIQLPNSSRAHRSNSKSSSTSSPPPANETPNPPAKRIKRSHDGPLSPSISPSPEERRERVHSPPLSPVTIPMRKIDTRGINDDVVVAVIEQLERTGNRPHLIKDLAAVLATTNRNIAHSANPAALLSSRLTSYFKREWTPLSPCPIGKELMSVHPRKVFFFLTTQPRQDLPENSDDIIPPAIKCLTPSISDPSIEDTDQYRGRMSLSPSPEVELYSPELEHADPIPLMPVNDFSDSSNSSNNINIKTDISPIGVPVPKTYRRSPNRVPSPPLEADERGFTETATAVRARGMSLLGPATAPQLPSQPIPSIEESDKKEEMTAEMRQQKDQELLFGAQDHMNGLAVDQKTATIHSPWIVPSKSTWQSKSLHLDPLQVDDIEMGLASWTLLSPEKVDIDELDHMFDEC